MIQIYFCATRSIEIKQVCHLELEIIVKSYRKYIYSDLWQSNPFSHFTVGEQKGCFCLIYSV